MAHCLDCGKVGDCWALVAHCEKTDHSWDDCMPNREGCSHPRRSLK